MLGILFPVLLLILSIPGNVFAETSSGGIGAVAGGLILRIANLSPGQSSSFYFLGGQGSPGDNSNVGQIKSTINSVGPLKTTLGLSSTGVYGTSLSSDSRSWTNSINAKNTGLRILPEGSVLMGGWSNNELNPGSPTNEVPLNQPDYDLNNLPQNKRNSGIYDFFLSMPTPDDPKSKAGLFLRQLVVGDNSNPTNIIIRRAQGNNTEDQTRYGQIGQLQVGGTSIGTIKWEGFTQTGFKTAAAIAATWDDIRPAGGGEVFGKGGLHFDTVGDEGQLLPRLSISANGDVTIPKTLNVAGSKNFMIDYPGKPGSKLIHASLEGPEAAVFYRGEGQLINGKATITLPDYFEKLTRLEERTIQLTGIDGFDKLAIKTQNRAQITDGRFSVYSDNPNSSQKFNWEVKAVRSDIPLLEVEKK